ncbi:MAG: hypothetical protein AB1489_29165 [Acidobacteriota bacterium]
MEDSQFYGLIFVIVAFLAAGFMLYYNATKKRRIEREYREALQNLRRNRKVPEARVAAMRAGSNYYGSFNQDGKPTRFDQEQILRDIQEATGELLEQSKPTEPPPVTRTVSEYRNMR